MLCQLCDEIVLRIPPGDSDGAVAEIETKIRTYACIQVLRDSSASCDFCGLLYEEAKSLETDHRGPYCKEKWGTELTEYLLARSPINVYHVSAAGRHNVALCCLLDAQNAPGYISGPVGYRYEARLGGIYVHTDSMFAGSIRGRPFSETITKTEMISLAKTWFNACENGDEEHFVDCENSFEEAAPERVLLVAGCHATRRIRLVLMEYNDDDFPPYACLSYCWGQRQSLMLTSDMLEAFLKEGLNLDVLPATIREACEVCDGIGIPYLFVDSLCILQDSAADWKQASKQMGSIYSSAALTIAAASSADCRDGLLSNRGRASRRVAELRCENDDIHGGRCLVRGRLSPEREPLDDRGWALQEDLLSPRILRIGTAEMSFRCGVFTFRESAVAARLPLDEISWNGPFKRSASITLPAGADMLNDPWRAYMWNYARRRLTFESDRLPAVEGIASWLSRDAPSTRMYSGYLFGMWLSKLTTDLLWFHDLPFPTDDDDVRLPLLNRAPSWSWAMYDSPYLEWVHCCKAVEHTESLNSEMVPELVLQGPLKCGWLVPDGTHQESFAFWADEWEKDATHYLSWTASNCLGRAYLDVLEPLPTAAHSFAELVRSRSSPCSCLRIVDCAGLLVQKIDEEQSDNRYRRVGLVKFKEDRSDEWWANASKETIRLL